MVDLRMMKNIPKDKILVYDQLQFSVSINSIISDLKKRIINSYRPEIYIYEINKIILSTQERLKNNCY